MSLLPAVQEKENPPVASRAGPSRTDTDRRSMNSPIHSWSRLSGSRTYFDIDGVWVIDSTGRTAQPGLPACEAHEGEHAAMPRPRKPGETAEYRS